MWHSIACTVRPFVTTWWSWALHSATKPSSWRPFTTHLVLAHDSTFILIITSNTSYYKLASFKCKAQGHMDVCQDRWQQELEVCYDSDTSTHSTEVPGTVSFSILTISFWVFGNGSLNSLRISSIDHINLFTADEIVKGWNNRNASRFISFRSIRGSISNYLD
jgi:hypothetical protein